MENQDLFGAIESKSSISAFVHPDVFSEEIEKEFLRNSIPIKDYDESWKKFNNKTIVVIPSSVADELTNEIFSDSSFLFCLGQTNKLRSDVIYVESEKELKQILTIAIGDLSSHKKHNYLRKRITDCHQLFSSANSSLDYLNKSLQNFKGQDLNKDQDLLDFIEWYLSFTKVSSNLIFLSDVTNVLKEINKAQKRYKIDLLDIENNSINFDANEDLMPLLTSKIRYMMRIDFKQSNRYNDLIKVIVLNFLRKFVEFKLMELDDIRSENLWEQAIGTFPYPVALIDENGELLVYNTEFTGLNIFTKDCLQMKPNEKIEIKDSIYNVEIRKIYTVNKVLFLYLFKSDREIETDESSYKSISSGELGIITSSIAHELNNPLAGIMASLTLIEMDEDWDESSLESISEMKEGVKRAQELIQVFLGFSRAAPNMAREKGVLKSFNQAMNLLSFRMIEANIRFDFENNLIASQPFKKDVNASVFSMIFYLILNDILTNLSHHKLVADNDIGAIEGEFKENENNILLRFDHEIVSKFRPNKLLTHLLDLEGVNLIVEEKQIMITEWTLT